MAYRTTEITQLMAYEFGSVEGDLSRLDERAVKSAIPSGMKYDEFIQKVKQGHLILLNDFPSIPLLIKEKDSFGSGDWVLNGQVAEQFETAAQNAFLARTRMSGGSGGYRQKDDSYIPFDVSSYVPEPPTPDYSDRAAPLKYEYCFEIASSNWSFHHRAGCLFVLARTKQEGMLGRWSKSRTEYGTRYTLQTAYNEPKKLVGQIASIPLGISLKQPVKVRPIGSKIAQEGFIPIIPTVQVGERLGFPLEGFYYHFSDNQFIQEYKIIGDQNWGFYATCSMPHRLDESRGYNNDQTAILVYWKIGGRIVDNQYLVYLDRQITREELDNLNDEWLNEHGVKLDIPEILEATKQPVAIRCSAPENKNESVAPMCHTVQVDPETGGRESWITIAQQYDLAPKELLELNPSYDADPMSLAVGHILNVEKYQKQAEPEPVFDLPPVRPKTINHPLNTHYKYSGRCLIDTKIRAINSENSIDKDVPVLNLKTLINHSKATDYGKLAFLAVPAVQNGATTLGIISANTASTMGQWTLSGEALASMAVRGAPLVAALWSSQLGDGTLPNSEPTATTRVRFNFTKDENGKKHIVGIKTGDGSPYGGRVAQRKANRVGQNIVAELDNGITITWTPDGSTDVIRPDSVFPEQDQLDVHNIWVRPIEEHQQELTTPLYPETDLAEYIITFPDDAGISPLYLVFSKPRKESGVVTGKGEDITGIWLEKAGEGLGAPIPSQLADKLRGREFSSFDAFRKAFWMEVSKDSELSHQFIPANQKRMSKGYSPQVRKIDRQGGRKSFELHHVEPIKDGGDVYHLDNLSITTPKRHIDIHKELK